MTGEAAGLAMGLTELGSKSASAIEDMVAYAQETQHEKILRGQIQCWEEDRRRYPCCTLYTVHCTLYTVH